MQSHIILEIKYYIRDNIENRRIFELYNYIPDSIWLMISHSNNKTK